MRIESIPVGDFTSKLCKNGMDIVIITGACDQNACDVLNSIAAAIGARCDSLPYNIVWRAPDVVSTPIVEFAARQIEPHVNALNGGEVWRALSPRTRAVVVATDDVCFSAYDAAATAARAAEFGGRLIVAAAGPEWLGALATLQLPLEHSNADAIANHILSNAAPLRSRFIAVSTSLSGI